MGGVGSAGRGAGSGWQQDASRAANPGSTPNTIARTTSAPLSGWGDSGPHVQTSVAAALQLRLQSASATGGTGAMQQLASNSASGYWTAPGATIPRLGSPGFGPFSLGVQGNGGSLNQINGRTPAAAAAAALLINTVTRAGSRPRPMSAINSTAESVERTNNSVLNSALGHVNLMDGSGSVSHAFRS